MTNTKRETPQSTDRPRTLNIYAPPKIREFGSIGALTQAGTAGVPEGMADMNVNRIML